MNTSLQVTFKPFTVPYLVEFSTSPDFGKAAPKMEPARYPPPPCAPGLHPAHSAPYSIEPTYGTINIALLTVEQLEGMCAQFTDDVFKLAGAVKPNHPTPIRTESTPEFDRWRIDERERLEAIANEIKEEVLKLAKYCVGPSVGPDYIEIDKVYRIVDKI